MPDGEGFADAVPVPLAATGVTAGTVVPVKGGVLDPHSAFDVSDACLECPADRVAPFLFGTFSTKSMYLGVERSSVNEHLSTATCRIAQCRDVTAGI